MIASDLKQNLATTIYLLFIHNYIVFAYFFGLLISIYIAIVRPSRFITFFLLGFAILVFSYEYDKHIIAGFREQTIKSFITQIPHYKLQKLINIAISEILPILFYLLGWGLIYIGIVIGGLKKDKKEVK